MSPLDLKLLRMLWRLKGQVGAIMLVIALGVMMLVMMAGLVNTLEETRRTYYERYRLADLFAPAVRAPNWILSDIAALPGVAAVEGRITGPALISVESQERTVRALAVSLPSYGRPKVNDYYLVSGRAPDSNQSDEILVLDGFAKAHGLLPGDSLTATMNGGLRRFSIVGLAQSPEFLYTSAPGELVPDDARFAVIWMSEPALAAAFDLKGAFNEALVLFSREANRDAIRAAIDRVLDPYGGLGAYLLENQTSNRFVSEEISGLRASASVVPPIFLGVAAFLLYIVIARMVQSEREQIGILKAFGYSSVEVGIHYLKFVLVVACLGAVLGSVLGVVAGRALSGIYQIYYKFPFLVFEIDPGVFIVGIAVSVIAASAGAMIVLRSVFSLSPAVAMRPPAPTDYSHTGKFGPTLKRLLDQPSRMVLRGVLRQPGRLLGGVAGISCGMALSVGMMSILAGFDRTIDVTFAVSDRSDALVSFIHPVSDKVAYELASMEGVHWVEPVRVVPATFRHGLNSFRGAVNGIPPEARLNRALDDQFVPVSLHTTGIVLSTSLASILNAGIGDTVTVEVLEGRRPTLRLPVTGVADVLLGSPAYMGLDALNRALKEPDRVSGMYLSAEPQALELLQKRIVDMPMVAGISIKHEARDSMQKVMDEGAGFTRYIMTAIAAVITFGIIYNSARIAFAEHARELASLRVIGFTKGESSYVLLGELAIVVLVSLPVGALMGYYLSFAISAGFSTEIYQVPTVFTPSGYGAAALAVVVASLLSGWIVKRDVDKIDMVTALKTRE